MYTSLCHNDFYFQKNNSYYFDKNLQANMYYVNGKSSLSDNIKDLDALVSIIELLKTDPLLYLMILEPNQNGDTPLDMAIESNSIKTVDLFLEALSEYKDFKLSNLLKHHFEDLFDMGPESFKSFLEVCTFQTEQMKMMNRIKIKYKGETELHSSYSSILDQRFNDMFIDKTQPKSQISTKKLVQHELSNSVHDDLLDDINDTNSDDVSLCSEVTIPLIEDDISTNMNANITDKIVEVKAVEFNWIAHTKEGSNFLNKL